jgi:hypothetical protein
LEVKASDPIEQAMSISAASNLTTEPWNGYANFHQAFGQPAGTFNDDDLSAAPQAETITSDAAVPVGTLATSVEVKARWAYSEIPSLRFGKKYVGHGPRRLHTLALGGAPFSNVDPGDWPVLQAMAEHARNKEFIDSIDAFGSPSFQCTRWRIEELLNVQTLPLFGRVSYSAFLTRNPCAVLRNGLPAFDEADPRVVAWSIDSTEPFEQIEPVIVVIVRGQPLLLDGYLRSLLWLRRNDPAKPLLVWLPVA